MADEWGPYLQELRRRIVAMANPPPDDYRRAVMVSLGPDGNVWIMVDGAYYFNDTEHFGEAMKRVAYALQEKLIERTVAEPDP
jgi:hypothetical protein